jgi:nucleotide-binding universal stress UspA family protein
MIKDILLVIDDSVRADPIIHAAAALAERLAATLTIEILSAGPILIPTLAPMTEMYIPAAELARDQAVRVEAVSAMVAAATASIRVVGLHDDLFMLADRTGKAGPIADLILIGDADLWAVAWLRARIAETVVMASGTPLIILSGATSLAPVHHAMIGWKDTSEARRALHDLIAVITPHAKIDVVGVGRNEGALPAILESTDEVVRHLRAHGFDAAAHAIPANGQSDAEALQGFALRQGAELLAVGAFGHSRLREIVFGGVTRALIEHPRLPVLLSR